MSSPPLDPPISAVARHASAPPIASEEPTMNRNVMPDPSLAIGRRDHEPKGRRLRGARAAALVLAGLTALAAAGCKKPEQAPKPDPSRQASAAGTAQAPIATRFAKVETRRLPRALDISGTLDADERSEVAAQAAGVALNVLVDAGSRVKKGDVLVELDGAEASLRVASANANATQQLARLGLKPGDKFDPDKVADVRAAKEGRDLAVLEAERAKKLFDSGGITQSAYDQARSAADRANAQLDAAKNGAEQAWAGLIAAQAQARLSSKNAGDTRVKAPFDGAVVEKRIAPGEFANVGRVVAVVVRDNPLRLRIDVPESDVAGVSEGQPVELTVAAYPGKTFKGVVKRVGASVKVQSRTLPIEAEVPNGDGVLRPGFFAKARVALAGEPQDSLLVPKAALGEAAGSARVFVKTGTRVSERLVTVGREVDGLVEVRGNLGPSDEVAVDDLAALSDAAEVVTK